MVAAPRQLDHLVLPVADLATARARLTSLGFAVAPDGHHPFGTSNCCVYFADGTFIEPLAVTDPSVAASAIVGGNVFVGRDRQFRETVAEEGLSAVVLASDDASKDHQEFERLGISGGPMLEFSRAFVDASGQSDEAKFRLTFATDSQSRGSYFFTCQRIRAPKVDRSALQKHDNRSIRPRATYWAAEEMTEKMRFWTNFLGLPPTVAEVASLTGSRPRNISGRNLVSSPTIAMSACVAAPSNSSAKTLIAYSDSLTPMASIIK